MFYNKMAVLLHFLCVPETKPCLYIYNNLTLNQKDYILFEYGDLNQNYEH